MFTLPMCYFFFFIKFHVLLLNEKSFLKKKNTILHIHATYPDNCMLELSDTFLS